MLAMSIVAIAGSAILIGLANSLDTTHDSLERTVASGIARQLMDEICGKRYAGAGIGPYQAVNTFGPNSWENSGAGRSRYDDVDDYHNYSSKPPKDPWGIALGQDDRDGSQRHPNFHISSLQLANWREQVHVWYVNESDFAVKLPSYQTSNFRAVEVRVFIDEADGSTREVAFLRKVIGYVPEPN